MQWIRWFRGERMRCGLRDNGSIGNRMEGTIIIYNLINAEKNEFIYPMRSCFPRFIVTFISSALHV
jgi:hypothetical protein